MDAGMRGNGRTRLLVDWGDPRAELRESLRVLRTTLPLLPPQAALTVLRVEFLGRRWPARALAASAALHLVLLLTPLPGFLVWTPAAPAELRAVRIEYNLQWTGNARLLPPIAPKRAPKKAAPAGGKKEQPLPRRGAETLQAQTIISDPPEPNHPRQTLLTQFGLDSTRIAPRHLRLPNMVIPPAPEATPRPEVDLRRARGAALTVPGLALAPRPPRPKSPSELALRQPKLENLMPRLAVPPAGGATNPGAAPDVGAAGLTASGDLPNPGILALSAQPALPRPVLELPETNLRARFATGPVDGPASPGGVPGAAPDIGGGAGGSEPGGLGGAEGSAGGLTVPGVFVAGAGPAPPGPVIVGPTSPPSAAGPTATTSPTPTMPSAIARSRSTAACARPTFTTRPTSCATSRTPAAGRPSYLTRTATSKSSLPRPALAPPTPGTMRTG